MGLVVEPVERIQRASMSFGHAAFFGRRRLFRRARTSPDKVGAVTLDHAFRCAAVARSPCRPPDRGHSDFPPAAGITSRLPCWHTRSALLYVFEWLGLPGTGIADASASTPLRLHAVRGSPHCIRLAGPGADDRCDGFDAALVERSRFGMSLVAIKRRMRRPPKPPAFDTLAWKLQVPITLSGAHGRCRSADFYAVILLVVTPPAVFGMLVSAQALIGRDVRRCRHAVGAGDRRGGAGAAEPKSLHAPKLGNVLTGHPGRGLWRGNRLL